MQKIEVEVKFYLADIDAMRTQILELGAKSNGRVFETNMRYEDKEKHLTEKNRCYVCDKMKKQPLLLNPVCRREATRLKFMKSWKLKSTILRPWAIF